MIVSLGDTLDRASIVSLKCERLTDSEDKKIAREELDALEINLEEHTAQLIDNAKKRNVNDTTYPERIKKLLDQKLNDFKTVNGRIWDLESDIRRGKEGELGLEEVGRRAIAIRDLNKVRIGIKNSVTKITGSGFLDIKVDHASDGK